MNTEETNKPATKTARRDGPELGAAPGSANADNGGCPPDCGHAPEEHDAFDAGVIEGRKYGYDAQNPHESGPDELREAWETGRSARACYARPHSPSDTSPGAESAQDTSQRRSLNP